MEIGGEEGQKQQDNGYKADESKKKEENIS